MSNHITSAVNLALHEQRRRKAREQARRDRRNRKLRAKCIRQVLFALLGRYCVQCGSVDDLTFDHPLGRGYSAAELEQLQRARHYVDDYTNGNLVVLCFTCNRHESRRYSATSRGQWSK